MSRLKSDIWKQLVEEAGVAELDAAATITVEQAEAELRAAGFDVAAERAKAAAFLDALERGATHAPAPPRVSRERRRPVLLWLAAATTVTVAGGALYAAMSRAPAPTPPPSPPTPTQVPSAVPDAVALRRQAAAACDAQQWDDCLADLDQARTLDPDGDAKPAMRALRARAIRAKDKPQ
jgi:hypothetical protein